MLCNPLDCFMVLYAISGDSVVLKQEISPKNGTVFFRPHLLGLCLCYKTLFYRISFSFCHRSSAIASVYPPPPQMTMGMLLTASDWFLSFLRRPCLLPSTETWEPMKSLQITVLLFIYTMYIDWPYMAHGQTLGLERDREPLPAGFTLNIRCLEDKCWANMRSHKWRTTSFCAAQTSHCAHPLVEKYTDILSHHINLDRDS